jgi:hypothetical protein
MFHALAMQTEYPPYVKNIREVVGVEVGSFVETQIVIAGKKRTDVARHYALSSSDRFEQFVGSFLSDDNRVRGEEETLKFPLPPPPLPIPTSC